MRNIPGLTPHLHGTAALIMACLNIIISTPKQQAKKLNNNRHLGKTVFIPPYPTTSRDQGLGPWLCCVTGVHIAAALRSAGHNSLQTQQISICLHHQAVAVNPTSFTGNLGVTNQLSLLCTRHAAPNHKIIVFTRAVDLKLRKPFNWRNGRL